MSDAVDRYGRALVAVETRPHQENGEQELLAEVQLRREQVREITADRDAWRREALDLRKRIRGRAGR